MQDTRTALPPGTHLELLSTGSIFEISGEPLGYGGGGIIYPARRMVLRNGVLQADGIYYALKECYPVSDNQEYFRSETGAIIAVNEECRIRLEKARDRHVAEKERNQAIHVTANRMLPILETADTIALTLPEKTTTLVSNAISVMESLENKGRSLNACLAERRRFSALETCRVLQQLLFALREVHQAGYLHLDIQGGNIFLRGALEENSVILTLIDFGSARPLRDGGKTDAIRDREIFTSQGFAASEILLHNTGALQLGVQADLYSAGCIALYLLTGQRPNQSQLLANRSGKYLKPNQIRRVNCPLHLHDQLQELLARSLAKDPCDRFHSADEMLEQVNKLLEALQPRKSALSAVKYDAFICYKHGPIDSPAAKALQQRLEHFRTTDDAGKKIRPFRKVFLDEGELSACADFGQQIHDALENSRWLLVVCSGDTPLSPWVKLEIDTFLKIHGAGARSRILTILTSGEPEESLPANLLDPEAGGSEPFAADIRGESLRQILKNLKGDAFLRLAAAMLDRPFDGLKQRQKIYILQRIAMVAGIFLLASAAFAAYAVNRANLIAAQAVRIQEEYEKALINESLVLAEQAQKALDNHNTPEAMAFALAALPSAKQDRPLVTEAEYLLGKALGIYHSPNAAEDTVTAVDTMDTDCSTFFLDDAGTHIFLSETYGKGIQVWDARSFSRIRELLPRDTIYHTSQDLLISAQTDIIVRLHGRIISLDYLTGAQNWDFVKENILAVRLSDDKTQLALLSEQETQTGENTYCLDILSAASGSRQQQFFFRTESDHIPEANFVLSPDLKWAAIPAVNAKNPSTLRSWHALYLLSLETGSCRKIADTDTQILAMNFVQDRLALVRGNGLTFTTRNAGTIYQYTEPVNAQIETYQPENGQIIWSTQQRYYLRDDSVHRITQIPYDTGTASGNGLLVTLADLCVLLDRDSGQILRQYTLADSALDICYETNGFTTINADGSCTTARYTQDTLATVQYFSDALSAVARRGETFYIQSAPVFSREYSIRKYQLGKSDESYNLLFDTELFDWQQYICSTTDGIRLVLAGENQLRRVDGTDGSVLTCRISPECGFSPWRITGISPDAHRVYWHSDDRDNAPCWITGTSLWITDFLTGESRPLPVPAKPEETMTVLDSLYFEESLYFIARIPREAGSEAVLFRWNPANNSLTELYRQPLASAENETWMSPAEIYLPGSLRLDARTRQISFATSGSDGRYLPEKLIRVSLSGENSDCISLAFTPDSTETANILSWNSHCYQWSPDGTRAVIAYEDTIYAVDRAGNSIFQIPAEGNHPVAFWLPDGEHLLVLTDNQILRQYRVSDGTCRTAIDLSDCLEILSSDPGKAELIRIDEKTMVLFNGSGGCVLDISGDMVKIQAAVPCAIGYDAAADRFLILDAESYFGTPSAFGTFRRYTLEELRQKANAILNQQP